MSFKQVITTASLLLASMSAHSALVFYTDFTTFDSATTVTLAEDFEAFPNKDVALASIYSNGISYTPIPPTTNVWVSSPGYTNYGINGATTSSILTATGDENFLITPDDALAAIGFDIYLNQYSPSYVTINGASGILGSYDLSSASHSEVGFLGVTSSEAIISLEWFTTGGGIENTGIDNIYTQKFVSTSVPEPASIALVGLGLIGLAATRRSRQS